MSEFLGNFLTVLAKHDRLNLLGTILHEAIQEQERRSEVSVVLVRSAVALSPAQLDSIRSQLKSAMTTDPLSFPRLNLHCSGD